MPGVRVIAGARMAENQSVDMPDNVVTRSLRQGFHAPLSLVLDVIYHDLDADCAAVMTTDHKNYENYWRALNQDDVLDVLRRRVVPHMFFELPRDREGIIDEFRRAVFNSGDRPDCGYFAWRLYEGPKIGARDDNWTLLFKQHEKDNLSETMRYLKGSTVPLLEKLALSGIRAHAFVSEDRWIGAFKEQKASCKGPDSTETELEACEANKLAYYKARFDSESTARWIDHTTEGLKCFISGGASQGAQPEDFEEYFRRGARVVRIDAPQDYAAYEQEYGALMEDIRYYLKEMGDDPPELVCFLGEDTFATTSNTPKDLLRALENRGIALVPYEDLRQEGAAFRSSHDLQKDADAGEQNQERTKSSCSPGQSVTHW